MDKTNEYLSNKQALKRIPITAEQIEEIEKKIKTLNVNEADKLIININNIKRNYAQNNDEKWNRLEPGSIIKTMIGTEYLACLVIEITDEQNKEIYVNPFHTFDEKYNKDIFVLGNSKTKINNPLFEKYVIPEEKHMIFEEPHDTYLSMKMADTRLPDDDGIRKISVLNQKFSILDKVKVLDKKIINDIYDTCLPKCKEVIYPEIKYIKELEFSNQSLLNENYILKVKYEKQNNKLLNVNNENLHMKDTIKELEERMAIQQQFITNLTKEIIKFGGIEEDAFLEIFKESYEETYVDNFIKKYRDNSANDELF